MLLRHAQIVTVALVALWVGLIALNNVTDYASNFEFVRHVMSMDTTFPDSRLTSRALTHPALHHLAYAIIIATEIAVATLCGWGALVLYRSRGETVGAARGKSIALAGYLLALVLWLGGFVVVGGEWFAMWQSAIWNGLDAAFRLIVLVTLFMLLLFVKEEAPVVEQRQRVAGDTVDAEPSSERPGGTLGAGAER